MERALLERRRQIREESARLTCEARKLNMKAAARKKRAEVGCISKQLQETAVLVFMKSRENAQVAALYVTQTSRTHDESFWNLSTSEKESLVRRWAEGMSDEQRFLLMNPVDSKGERRMNAACRFLAGLKTAAWTLQQNKSTGLAPHSADVVKMQRETFHALGQEVTDRDADGDSASHLWRSVGKRWRRKWLFRYGKMRVQEILPVEELREKARGQSNCF
jgi:hypothetical protein